MRSSGEMLNCEIFPSSQEEEESFTLFNKAIKPIKLTSGDEPGLSLSNKKNLNITHLIHFIKKLACKQRIQYLDLSDCDIEESDLLKFINFLKSMNHFCYIKYSYPYSVLNSWQLDYFTIYLKGYALGIEFIEEVLKMESRNVKLNLDPFLVDDFIRTTYEIVHYNPIYYNLLHILSMKIQNRYWERIDNDHIRRFFRERDIKEYILFDLEQPDYYISSPAHLKKLNTIVKIILDENSMLTQLEFIYFPLCLGTIQQIANSSACLVLQECYFFSDEYFEQFEGNESLASQPLLWLKAIKILGNSSTLSKIIFKHFNFEYLELLEFFAYLNVKNLYLSFSEEWVDDIRAMHFFLKSQGKRETLKALSRNFNLYFEITNQPEIMKVYHEYRKCSLSEILFYVSSLKEISLPLALCIKILEMDGWQISSDNLAKLYSENMHNKLSYLKDKKDINDINEEKDQEDEKQAFKEKQAREDDIKNSPNFSSFFRSLNSHQRTSRCPASYRKRHCSIL